MKRIILLELCLLFLATTFQGDRLTGWVQQTIPRQDLPVMDLQFLDTMTGFMVSTKPAVDTAFIFKTTDGGNNWSTTFFDSLYLVCMDMVDKNIGYCGGAKVGSGILKKTTNGGDNWFTVSSIPFMIIGDVNFVNKDTGWVCGTASSSGGLWRTTNGGLTLEMQMNSSSQPSKVFFINSSTGWFIGSANGGLYKTTNSGVNWFLQTYISSLSDVFFATPDTGWVIGGSGIGLMRSTSGGDTWHTVNIPAIPFETRLFFINNKLGWGGSLFNKIYATKDGFNWGKQYSPSNRSDNIYFADTLHGWAGYFGLVHTTDGGGEIVGINNITSDIPKDYVLEQNYPNPFNATSKIKYKTSKIANIQIKIFDINGKEIAMLINQKQSAGSYEYSFDGNKLSSGIYFYSLFADGQRIDTKKMSLIK